MGWIPAKNQPGTTTKSAQMALVITGALPVIVMAR
jgi:hypothetical protein